MIVHVKIYIPSKLTVAVDVPLFAALKDTEPGPDVTDHAPVPIMGVLPPSEVLVNVQLYWSAPTVAVVGFSSKLIEILASL